MSIIINGDTGVSGVDGSAATPSYQGTDTNTGIFYPAADTVAFGTSGSERMRIDSSGNVGIGTSSPGTVLDVNGQTKIRQSVENAPVSGSTNFLIQRQANDSRLQMGYVTTPDAWVINTSYGSTGAVKPLVLATSDTERMRITSGGNVGIGTTNPSARLHVENLTADTRVSILSVHPSDSNFQLAALTGVSTNNSGDVVARFGLGFTTTKNSYINFHRGGGTTGGFMSFSTNDNTERMRIDSSGNVGIGTTPTYKLDVYGQTRVGGGSTSQQYTQFKYLPSPLYGAAMFTGADAGVDQRGIKIAAQYDGTNKIVTVFARSTDSNAYGADLSALTYSESMRIDSSGNVGIGTTTPTYNFHVKETDGATSISSIFETTVAGGSYISFKDTGTSQPYNVRVGSVGEALAFQTSSAERMRIHSSGGVSIGNTTDSGAASLNVSGSMSGGYIAHAAGTTAMAFGADNVVRVTPNATATYTSTVPAAGAICVLSILTSGTTSYTITFGTGFKSTGTLATGTVSARYFNITFVSDGTNLIETSRTVAIA